VVILTKQGVALTGRNATGPPRVVSSRYRRLQTPTTVTSQATLHYVMCRRASNNPDDNWRQYSSAQYM